MHSDRWTSYSYQYTQVRPHKIEIWNNGSQAKFPNKRWGWVAAFFFFIGNKVDERGIFQKINIGNLRFQKDIHVSCEMSVNVNCWCNLVHIITVSVQCSSYSNRDWINNLLNQISWFQVFVYAQGVYNFLLVWEYL